MNHETRKIILDHNKCYPQSEVEDFIKLLFQNEFGGGHLVSEPTSSLERIAAEGHQTLRSDILVQDIGNGFARLHLGNQSSISNGIINRMFMESAKYQPGTIEGLTTKLMILLELIQEGALSFPLKEAEHRVYDYIHAGCPMTSHSQRYRSAYAPAYRVVRHEFSDFIPLYERMEEILEKQRSILLVIEGGSASGKSTLAQCLALLFKASVIPMDDFFLQAHQRTPERLVEIGGNIDYQRFNAEVSDKICQGNPFTYQKFDCSSMTLAGFVEIPPHNVVIVEGVYSRHPKLRLKPDLTVFLDINPARQKERLNQRNSPPMVERFLNEWIPMENKYFHAYFIKEIADLVFTIE